jgi:hypothetical protein
MFQIQTVPIDARDELEEIGSKAKFWYEPAGQGRRQWLFKESRVEQGEDWSEKIAAELADLLGLPHAVYDLPHGTDGGASSRLAAKGEKSG